MNLRNNIRGITMLEVIISLFIITIAATIASTMIISSLQGNRLNKNKLIAINLAREGSEAVLNIIDGNVLRYKANKNECWNFWENPEGYPPVTKCDPLDPDANRIQAGYYLVNIGRDDLGPSFATPTPPYTYKWYLSTSSLGKSINDDSLKISEDIQDAQLELWTPDSKNADYRLYVAQTHPVTNNTATDFYRQIQIEYPNDTDNIIDKDDTTVQVTSIVVWFEKGQKKKVKSINILPNYME